LNTTPTNPDIELVLAAQPQNVAVARQVVGGIGDALGMTPEAVADVRLAVSEACTNVIVHAYEDPEGEEFALEVSVSGQLMHIAVRDSGRGFMDTATMPSEGLGIGLQILERVGEEVQYSEAPGENEVRMTFVVPGAG
jgi:anti-sigma regulatory factor (Ser/Thr protein kinase)